MTNRIKTDTGAAKLPAIPRISLADRQLSNWVNSVTEHLQVRNGERGNENERVVTLRELKEYTNSESFAYLSGDKKAGPGEMVVDLGGGLSATLMIDKFAQSILDSFLFKQLAKTLDDPTRFDHLAKEIRDELLKSITDEAAKRGAEIRDTQTIIQNNERSFAMAVTEVTASLNQASAGLRQLQAAWSDASRAMATNVLQLSASLGNYYQDGRPGRASLEQEMTVMSDYANGLRAQYTLKVQAGGALAGFGIAAEEVNGKTSSAFIIMADKFAIVAPNYSDGLLRTPRTQDVVFGVDALGIYMQNNVYIKGNMRVDGTGRTIANGMRGSVLLRGSGSSWSDATARQVVWASLGNSGTAPNSNHLQIGDAVTITNGTTFTQTRHWMGTGWSIPAAAFNGDLLVDGTVAAKKINTNGLTVRDNSGNVILDANGINASWVRNIQAAQVNGLGPMATARGAVIGETVTLPNGYVLQTTDFVNRLTRITTGNISTFIDGAAIGTAYIGQAAIGTLQVQGGAITAMQFGQSGSFSVAAGSYAIGGKVTMTLPANTSGVTIIAAVEVQPNGGDASVGLYIRRDGGRIGYSSASVRGGWSSQMVVMAHDRPPAAGSYTYDVEVVSPSSGPGANQALSVARTYLVVTGGKR